MINFESKHLLLFQFVWFLAVWFLIARYFVLPYLQDKAKEDRLALLIAPQMFRVLGVGLLVSNLSPGMPYSFAFPTAVGDTATAVLAVSAVIALKKRLPIAIILVWIANVFGSLDLIYALFNAAQVGAADFLKGQWFVPALILPLMVVSHLLVFWALLVQTKTNE